MTISPTAVIARIKKELINSFKGTKFSITTTSHHLVYIEWKLEIGTNATVDAVLEILKSHGTSVHYKNSVDNTMRSTGVICIPRPKYTKEREDQARKVIEETNSDVTWHPKWKRFDAATVDKSENYAITRQYHFYLENGLSCSLAKENVENFGSRL